MHFVAFHNLVRIIENHRDRPPQMAFRPYRAILNRRSRKGQRFAGQANQLIK